MAAKNIINLTCPSPSAGDLRELPRVPLRGEGSCGGGGAKVGPVRRPWVGPVGVGGVHRWGREVSREKKDNGVSTSCYSHGDVGPDPEGTPGRLSGTKLRMSLQGGGGWASLHQSHSQFLVLFLLTV